MTRRTLIQPLLLAGIIAALAWATEASAQPDHAAVKPVPREGNWPKRHEDFLAIAKKGNIDLLFLGDSITDAWGGEGHNPNANGTKVWKKLFEPMKAANFGIGGDRTQHVLWRLQNGELDGFKPKVAVLMIGTNNSNGKDNTAQEIADGITAIVKEIHKRSPDTKVLLLGVFPRGKDPTADAIKAQREKLADVNKLIAKLDDGGKKVKYLDIGAKFLEADSTISKEIMPDFLHLSEKGYEIWGDAIKGPIEELMKK